MCGLRKGVDGSWWGTDAAGEIASGGWESDRGISGKWPCDEKEIVAVTAAARGRKCGLEVVSILALLDYLRDKIMATLRVSQAAILSHVDKTNHFSTPSFRDKITLMMTF